VVRLSYQPIYYRWWCLDFCP